jgi:hypothetical protein
MRVKGLRDMPKTTSLLDCRRLAGAVRSVGGVVPDVLGHLPAPTP